jgi:predicted amidophosphoribosyltransferase
VRDTQSQSGLDKQQRRKNIRGAFQVIRPVSAEHVVIVDDVVTTTSTVNELARVLKKAGVRRVDVWSIARAV